jgi:hypothetical protein
MSSKLNGSAEGTAKLTENVAENYPLTPVTSPLDVHTLAYIVHPSHDIASIDTAEEEPPEADMTGDDSAIGKSHLVTQASSLLGITVEEMHT